jgi:non-ribosomal peptide synthetase component F
MEVAVVHRIVEQHAATRGETLAIVCGHEAATYRELNVRANGIARQFMQIGLRRGGHATVRLAHGMDLAAVLLAVLKAGASYTWIAGSGCVRSVAISGQYAEASTHAHVVDLTSVLGEPLRSGPNLPVLTRATDTATVIGGLGDASPMLVPHETLAALRRPAIAARPQLWDGDPSTFDLWTGLLSGATLSVESAPALINAA